MGLAPVRLSLYSCGGDGGYTLLEPSLAAAAREGSCQNAFQSISSGSCCRLGLPAYTASMRTTKHSDVSHMCLSRTGVFGGVVSACTMKGTIHHDMKSTGLLQWAEAPALATAASGDGGVFFKILHTPFLRHLPGGFGFRESVSMLHVLVNFRQVNIIII